MHKFNIRIPIRERISFLQRKVLIHSYLYYEKNKTILYDFQYDNLCKELISYQNKMGVDELKQKTDYGYAFYDFDGTTGFDLYWRLKDGDKETVRRLSEYITRLQGY